MGGQRPLNLRERPDTHLYEAELSPGPVWTGAENLAPTGIGFPDLAARSESLYGLSYPCMARQSVKNESSEFSFAKAAIQ